jgi:two-component system, OmpR family, alkaline phosphatase synthesis response regulator PhoP
MMPAAKGESLMTSSDASAKDIIVADNDYIIRSILRSVLEREGFTVILANDGLEAVAYAKRTQAGLIILDYRMPALDGIAACAEIRRLPGYARVPIIILTAFDDDHARVAAEDAGATAFFPKPFKPVDLLRCIETWMPHAAAQSAGCGFAEPPSLVWKRSYEPAPLFGEPCELSEGRRLLHICRR